MAIGPPRKWWIEIRKNRLWRGRWFALHLSLDYWSLSFYLSLGWFAVHLEYFMPQYQNLTIASSGAFMWEAEQPLVEGCIAYRNIRQWKHVHTTVYQEEFRTGRRVGW